MDDDLLSDWRQYKFIRIITDDINVKCYHLIVLTDISFWAENVDALKEWCDEHECTTSGMTVQIPTDELYTLFCLRWH